MTTITKVQDHSRQQRPKNEAVVQFMERRTHQSIIQEYKDDIHDHIFALELALEQEPIPQPLQRGLCIVRNSLLNSIFDVTEKLRWSFATFSLAANLIDRYTSMVEIKEPDYKFTGYCCLWIASKYNENKPKGKLIDALIKRAGYDISRKKEFLTLEFRILSTMKWDLSYPTADSFLDMFIHNSQPNHLERKTGSLFLCELALFEKDVCFNYSASSIAAASVMLTNIAVNNPTSTNSFNRDFDELESLLLQATLSIHISVKVKYFGRAGVPTSRVVANLIDMATSLNKKKQELDSLYNAYTNQSSSPIQEFVIYSGLPLSPIASPTHHQVGSHHRHSHSRSQSITALRSLHLETSKAVASSSGISAIPTPGTTPTASNSFLSSISSASSGSLYSGAPSTSSSTTTTICGSLIPSHILSNSQQVVTPVQLHSQFQIASKYNVPNSVGSSMCSAGNFLSTVPQLVPITTTVTDEEYIDGRALKKRKYQSID